MCGLVGVLDRDGVSVNVVQRMTASLVHRGPDDAGFAFLDAGRAEFVTPAARADGSMRYPFGMGFRRLSILDLSPNGHQPMVTRTGRYALTYNGEIYNFRELKAELVVRGHQFESTSDTEVVLQLFEAYGVEAFRRLNGMFALAIYDRDTSTLTLARDRLGIKPLYYYRSGTRFMYASEVKAFLAHPQFRAELNGEHLNEYLLFRYVADPETLLRGVRAVEGGTFMTVRGDAVESKRYWAAPRYAPVNRTPADSRRELANLVEDSVAGQLVSDVKVGCQLSGGVDSSLVSYWARTHHGPMFDSVSVVLGDPTLSEEPFIDTVNARLQLAGHKATLTADYVLRHLGTATWHNDFPLSVPNSIGIFLLSEEARRHVTVLLSGEGADEVFGGYHRFYRAAWIERACRAGWLASGRLRSRLLPFGGVAETLVGLSAYGDPDILARVCPTFVRTTALERRLDIWSSMVDESSSLVERMLSYEQRTYLVDLLMRQDKMCMAHSIENRVPLLDHRIVELAKTLPTRFKVNLPIVPLRGRSTHHTKRILKQNTAAIFGPAFTYRSKSGFPIPLQAVFAHPAFRGPLEECRAALRDLGCMDMAEVDGLHQRAAQVGGWHAETFWILMALGTWLSVFLDRGRASVRAAYASAI